MPGKNVKIGDFVEVKNSVVGDGTKVSHLTYIGDSDVDVDTAKEAGMDGIFVNWGFRGREFLLEHGAKCVVDTPEELERLLTGKA